MSIPKGFIPEDVYNAQQTNSDNVSKEALNNGVPTGFVEETSGVSKQDIDTAKNMKFFGWQPNPETIQPIRHAAGVGLRGMAKGVLGTPGDILNLISTVTKNKIPSGFLPDSETIGNFFNKTSGEDFSPQNVPEEFLERGMEFLGSMMGLGGGAAAKTATKAFGKNIMRAFIPAGVDVIGEKLNLPPWLQAASTIGAGILTHKFTSQSFRDMENALYKNSRKMAEGLKIDTTPALDALEKFKENKILTRTPNDPYRKFLSTVASDAESVLMRNVITADDWMNLNRSLNAFGPEASKLKGAKRLLGEVKGIVQGLDKQLVRQNPEFVKIYRQANSLHRGLNEARFIENFIKQNPKLASIGGGVSALISHSLGLGIPAAGGLAAAKVAETVSSLYRNPGLRKAYFEVLRNAASENKGGTLKALNAFNKEAKDSGIEF